MTEATYSAEVSTVTDHDSHYKATITRDGMLVKVLFDPDRGVLLERVRAWVEGDRTFEADTPERITL